MKRDSLGAVLDERMLIFIAGTKLARYADQIVELTGLGQLWIGVALVSGATSLRAFSTSLPELGPPWGTDVREYGDCGHQRAIAESEEMTKLLNILNTNVLFTRTT
ncbi:MAG: hypothetical protein OEV51_05310 [Nitrospira sp.]|nr:hypothetical protein [Nitrospira sp.]